jgi:hypothetical protein
MRWAGGGARSAPFLCVHELKKTGARTRGQNPLVSYIYLGYFVCACVCVCVCVCVTICVRTLCYSFSFINQTDQGDEREGLKREGLKRRDKRGRDWRGRV